MRQCFTARDPRIYLGIRRLLVCRSQIASKQRAKGARQCLNLWQHVNLLTTRGWHRYRISVRTEPWLIELIDLPKGPFFVLEEQPMSHHDVDIIIRSFKKLNKKSRVHSVSLKRAPILPHILSKTSARTTNVSQSQNLDKFDHMQLQRIPSKQVNFKNFKTYFFLLLKTWY